MARAPAALIATLLACEIAAAQPELAALAPPAGDDARKAIAIGPAGQIYEPDGKGAWIRRLPITTADRLAVAGRADGDVVAGGEGVVYRLALNGWTALRLAQKGKAVLAGGPTAIAAIGRQVFTLDKRGGEARKLFVAPSPVRALGAGKQVVIAIDRGLFRIANGKLAPIAGAPRRVDRLVADTWALLDHGAHELATRKLTRWPAGLTVAVAAPGPAGSLVAVATSRGKLELVTVRAGKLVGEPISILPVGKPVGIAIDKRGRAVIALRDGRLAVRDAGVWTTSGVTEALPAARPGAPPANSP